MVRRSGAVLTLIGCAGSVTPVAKVPKAEAPQIPHERYWVVPAELGDPDVEPRIHHRVWLARHGKIWLGATATDSVSDEMRVLEELDLRHVIGETHQRIQITVEEDPDARYAVWIDRADAAPAALREVALAASVRLARGAPLAILETRGDQRRVALVDDAVAIEGWVDAGVVGEVWIAPRAIASHDGPRTLVDKAQIRDAPRSSAAVIATARRSVPITVLGPPRDGWLEVELARPYAHVHGFARADAIVELGDLFTRGRGGTGFGVSDTKYVEVAAGACLFDRPDGEVIGVNVRRAMRYSYPPHPEHPGWWTVFAGSPWSVLTLYVHDQVADPTVHAWERCTKP